MRLERCRGRIGGSFWGRGSKSFFSVVFRCVLFISSSGLRPAFFDSSFSIIFSRLIQRPEAGEA